MSPAERSGLSACARGEMSLAAARAVPGDALAAARAIAWEVAAAGRHDLAFRILSGAVALDPYDGWSQRALAVLRLHGGEPARAVEAASAAVRTAEQRGGADPEAALLLGRALVAAGRREEAVGWLSSAARDPSCSRTARAVLSRIGHAAPRADGPSSR